MWSFDIDDIEINYEYGFVDLSRVEKSSLRIPFYEVNRINVFPLRIGIWYKTSRIAVYRGNEMDVKKKQKELEKTGMKVRNIT